MRLQAGFDFRGRAKASAEQHWQSAGTRRRL